MRHLDWSGIQGRLQRLATECPGIFHGSVLVGGAACWFYRIQLEKRASPDFPPPALTEVDAGLWLSKDIDFANLPEATPQLPLVGRLQFGVRLSASDFLENARTATIGGVTLLVADALDLLKEKQACCAKLGRPQDFLHKTTLEAFVSLDLADRVAAAAQDPARAPSYWQRKSLIHIYAPELLARNPLNAIIAKF